MEQVMAAMRQANSRIVVVLDEIGGTAGILTAVASAWALSR
jgi:CBS domain containing-hemolysin-like protein